MQKERKKVFLVDDEFALDSSNTNACTLHLCKILRYNSVDRSKAEGKDIGISIWRFGDLAFGNLALAQHCDHCTPAYENIHTAVYFFQ